MATTGTTSFSPALGELTINAFARCGVRRTELLQQHLEDARFETNLIMADWTASGVNLWTVDLHTIPLVAGTATYSVPADTVFLLDVYLSLNGTDRLISALSRSDYAALADKTTQGTPTSFWFNRLLAPEITLWLVPNSSDAILKFYRATQLQDAELAGGAAPEVPYRFLDALQWQLAARLATIYAPERAIALDARAQRAWQNAISSDTENVGIRIYPQLQGYFR